MGRIVCTLLAMTVALGGLAACETEEVDLPGDAGEEAPGPTERDAAGPEDAGAADGGAALDDHGALGSLGPSLLRDDVPGAQVEIDTSEGVDLSGSAQDALAQRLAEHGGKDVTFTGGDTLPSRDSWSNEQLRSVAREHRATSSSTSAVAVHVLVVSGDHHDDRALGVALDASTFVVFPDAMQGGILGGLQSDDVEVAVTVHELGHLFGLVNLTGEGGFHESADHPHHSDSEDSVMHWAIETDAVSRIFDGPPPTTFDEADRQEMERIRS